MNYIFTSKGHHNVLALHKNTLEFTSEEDLSLRGDCIVGIGAKFSLKSLKEIAAASRAVMKISCEGVEDSLEFTPCKEFCSEHEIVVRLSDHRSDRTFGVRADKAAKHLKRELVDKLKKDGALIQIELLTVET